MSTHTVSCPSPERRRAVLAGEVPSHARASREQLSWIPRVSKPSQARFAVWTWDASPRARDGGDEHWVMAAVVGRGRRNVRGNFSGNACLRARQIDRARTVARLDWPSGCGTTVSVFSLLRGPTRTERKPLRCAHPEVVEVVPRDRCGSGVAGRQDRMACQKVVFGMSR